jgi:hypothetical protein
MLLSCVVGLLAAISARQIRIRCASNTQKQKRIVWFQDFDCKYTALITFLRVAEVSRKARYMKF